MSLSRVTFAKNSAGAPEITDTYNYYPFGLNHTGGNGLNSSNFGSFYSYKYNGKELQETGMFDYGWRQYMPDLGRWNGIDQLAESYHMASPYAYVMNNPISFLDPDGRDVKPTRDGYEFSGSDLQNVMGYLQGGGSARKLVSSLSAWEKEESGGNFWSFFGSWNSWGATGGDVGGNLYASTWGDGAMGATIYDIQEIVFTKTKITNVQSISDWKEQGALAARQPGRAQMMGSPGDPFGFFEGIGIAISAQESQPLKLAMLPLFIVTKNGDDALKILAAEKGAFSVFDWKGYPTSLSKPTGPFKILEGAEYEAARKATNNANRALHRTNPEFKGLQIHEIHPVKFGGDPTNPLKKHYLHQKNIGYTIHFGLNFKIQLKNKFTMYNNLIFDKLAKNEIPSQSLYEKLIKKNDFNIDKDYLDFISKYNGAEGAVNADAYLSFWDIENILSCNPYYEDVEECLNLFFFGTDGSNYGYAFDKNTGKIIGIDFLDIGNTSPNIFGNSFTDFLISFSNNEHE
ncbi:hypothetical protein LF887_07010 [Chryseobacterium sp. MEBOG06]|uniref:RHS repeat-associated core domain-containing protein n=1 Tax=Chryseobacterium sp. MEBOG06 TaxID=2879938 RepID=UPI001F42F622|nr:RHS repeat-associated core domain-containing protein [Chryseobacterium sp. MEBOG06]UKB85368.1 hypothetical protein LF887_07010 [Chryseobacterium sp. MEBOG06]